MPRRPETRNHGNPSRSYVFTENDPGSIAVWRERLGAPGPAAGGGSVFPGGVRYCSAQLERGEQELREHLQGYIELSKPQRLSWLKSNVSTTAHFEPRRGTRDQARDYSRKDDTRVEGPWEFGTWESGGSGARNDLQAVADRVKEGATLKEIAEEHPVQFIRYSRGIKELHSVLSTKVRNPDTPHRCIVMLGPPGCGKTKLAHALFPGAYWKPPAALWFPNYNGEDCVIFDDLNSGWFTMDEYKRAVDRYQYMGQTKGGYVSLANDTTVITSNTLPHRWYKNKPDELPAITRRITEFWIFTGMDEYFPIYNDGSLDPATGLPAAWNEVSDFFDGPQSYMDQINDSQGTPQRWHWTTWPGKTKIPSYKEEYPAIAVSYVH